MFWKDRLLLFHLAQQDAVVVQRLAGVLAELLQQVIHRHPAALFALHIEHDAARIHHQGAVAQFQRLMHVVSDHQAGDLLFGHDVPGQLQHLFRRGGVQSGGLLVQYQKSCDINVGTGMVTIALASLIIGETLVGKRTMLRRILGVVFGSCLYRFIVAVALRFNVPAAAMKLVSAIIVAIAISMPAIKEKIAFEQRKHGACRRRVTTGKEGK